MLKDKDFYFLNKHSNSSNEIFIQNINSIYAELKDKEISFLGQLGIKSLFKSSFHLRQRYVKYLDAHSNIKDVKINKPIFVSGLPRSGTTYLHNLLIHFLDRDGLEFWELTEPIPYFNNSYMDIKLRKISYLKLLLNKFSDKASSLKSI